MFENYSKFKNFFKTKYEIKVVNIYLFTHLFYMYQIYKNLEKYI